jgi:hypothetical protein
MEYCVVVRAITFKTHEHRSKIRSFVPAYRRRDRDHPCLARSLFNLAAQLVGEEVNLSDAFTPRNSSAALLCSNALILQLHGS